MAGTFGTSMNQLKPPTKSSHGSNPQGKSNYFIESLKTNPSSTPKDQLKAATTGMIGSFSDQLFGGGTRQENTNFNNPPINFNEFLKSREKQIRFQERKTVEQQQTVEKLLYSRKEEETKIQIKTLQEEIKKLALATQDLSTEIIEAEKTVATTIVTTGTYHINFLERIRRLITLARKRIIESKNWLALFNSRQKHRSLYWANVGKSGTKYMLSQERYLVMSAG